MKTRSIGIVITACLTLLLSAGCHREASDHGAAGDTTGVQTTSQRNEASATTATETGGGAPVINTSGTFSTAGTTATAPASPGTSTAAPATPSPSASTASGTQ